MAIEVDIVANESSIESALKKISTRLKTLEVESRAVSKNISNVGVKSIDSKQISQELKSLRQDLSKTNKELASSVNGLSNGFSNLARNLTLALTGGALTAGFVGVTSKFSELENRIALVTGRTDNLILTQEKLISVSAKTFTSVEGSVETFNRFGLALRDAGVETETLIEVTENVQKAIAISGGSAQSASAAIFQLGQGLSAGALRGQELNSVLEQAPRIATAIADELGVSIGQLRAIAEEGGLSADVVMKALLNQGAAINKEFKNIAPSITKSSVVFLDAVTNYIGQVDKGLGLSKSIAAGTLNLSRTLNEASVDLDLRVAERVKDLNVVQTFKDIQLVAGGIFNVLGAIVGRIGSSFPKVIVPVLTLFDQLSLALFKIPTVEFFAAVTRSLLAVRASFLEIASLGGGVSSAFTKVFQSTSVVELRQNLDDLASAIDNYGKRWFNVFNFATTIVRQTNVFLVETGRYLGILDQKLIEFRFDTFEDFGFLLEFSSKLLVEFTKNFLAMNVIVSLFSGALIFEAYLGRMLEAAKNTFDDITAFATSGLTKVTKIITKFSSKIRKTFYDLYIYLVGGSVWPDTIEGIVKWTNYLLDTALPIINTFSAKIKTEFSKTLKFLRSLFSNSPLANLLDLDFDFKNLNLDFLKDYLSNLFEQIDLSALDDIKSKISDKFKELTNTRFDFSLDIQLNLAQALNSLIIFVQKAEIYLASKLLSGILSVWGELNNSAPVLANLLAAGIVTGLAELFGVKLFAALKTLLLGTLVANVLNKVLQNSGELLIDEGFFENIGQSAGKLVGTIIKAIFDNLPLLLQGLLDVAKGFAHGLLDQLGIVGKSISLLISATPGIGSIIEIALFGAGIAALLGKFKMITTVINAGLTLLLSKSIGGVGSSGILQFLLLGKGRTVIAAVLGVIAVLNLIPGIFNDIGNTVSTFISVGGLVSVLLFGAGGTFKGIVKTFDAIINYIGLMSGLMSVNGKMLNLTGYLWPASGALSLKARIAAWFAWFRFQYYSAIGGGSLATVLGTKLANAVYSFTTWYTMSMGRLRNRSLAIGGPLGTIGSVLFGKIGRAALLAAVVLGLFTTVAMASEDAASSGFGLGFSALEYGMLGVMLFGAMGPRSFRKLVISSVNFVKLQFRALIAGLAIEAAVATALGAGFKAGLVTVGIMLLRFVGTIFAVIFSKIGAVILGVGLLGLMLFGKGDSLSEKWTNFKNSVTDFFTNTTEGGRAARESIEGVLAPLKGSALGDINFSGAFKSLDAVDLSGLNASQIGDMKASLKQSVNRLEELKTVYEQEGKLTRGERREANALLKEINDKIKEAPEIGTATNLNVQGLLSAADKLGVANLPQTGGGLFSSPTSDIAGAADRVVKGTAPISAFIDIEELRGIDPIAAELADKLNFALSQGFSVDPKLMRDVNEMLVDRIRQNTTGTLENVFANANNFVLQQDNQRQEVAAKQLVKDLDTAVMLASNRLSKEEAIATVQELQQGLGFEQLKTDEAQRLSIEGALLLQQKLKDLSDRTVNISGANVPVFGESTSDLFNTPQLIAQRKTAEKEFEILKNIYSSESGVLVDSVNESLNLIGVNLTLSNFDAKRLNKFVEGASRVLEAEAANIAAGSTADSKQALDNAKQAFRLELLEYKATIEDVLGSIDTSMTLEDVFSASQGTQSQIESLGKELLKINEDMATEAYAALPLSMKEGISANRTSIVNQLVALFRQVAIETKKIDYFGEGRDLSSQIQDKFNTFTGNNPTVLPLNIMGPQDTAAALKAIEAIDQAYTNLQTDMSNGIKPDFGQSVSQLSSKLLAAELQFTSFEDRLEYARSLADNPIDFNELIKLPREKLNQLDLLTIKLRALQIRMVVIKTIGAITGSDIFGNLKDVSAQIDATIKQMDALIPEMPDSGGGDAKTWWEDFVEKANSLELNLSDKLLAGLDSTRLDVLVKASEDYKKAQEAITKSTKNEVDLRQKSLAIMRQAREEAAKALRDGTLGGLQAQTSALGQEIDLGILAQLTQSERDFVSSALQRIQAIQEELRVTDESSIKARQLAAELDLLTGSVERLTNFSTEVRSSVQSGLAEFLKGTKSFGEVLDVLLDTFTNKVIESFTTGFTDALFEKFGLDRMFNSMFNNIFNLGGNLVDKKLGSTPRAALWVRVADAGVFPGKTSLPRFFATGGYVSGPGTGTSDSIPSMLSNGEYVINAQATRKFGPVLEAINSGTYGAFATGGPVGSLGGVPLNDTMSNEGIAELFRYASGFNDPLKIGGWLASMATLSGADLPTTQAMQYLFGATDFSGIFGSMISGEAHPAVYGVLGASVASLVSTAISSAMTSKIPYIGQALSTVFLANDAAKVGQGYSAGARQLGHYNDIPNWLNSMLYGFETSGVTDVITTFKNFAGGGLLANFAKDKFYESISAFVTGRQAPRKEKEALDSQYKNFLSRLQSTPNDPTKVSELFDTIWTKKQFVKKAVESSSDPMNNALLIDRNYQNLKELASNYQDNAYDVVNNKIKDNFNISAKYPLNSKNISDYAPLYNMQPMYMPGVGSSRPTVQSFELLPDDTLDSRLAISAHEFGHAYDAIDTLEKSKSYKAIVQRELEEAQKIFANSAFLKATETERISTGLTSALMMKPGLSAEFMANKNAYEQFDWGNFDKLPGFQEAIALSFRSYVIGESFKRQNSKEAAAISLIKSKTNSTLEDSVKTMNDPSLFSGFLSGNAVWLKSWLNSGEALNLDNTNSIKSWEKVLDLADDGVFNNSGFNPKDIPSYTGIASFDKVISKFALASNIDAAVSKLERDKFNKVIERAGSISDYDVVKGFATGGYISGAGTGTSDSIPAMLSNGEYVINAKATKKFGPILSAINSGDYQGFAAGSPGMVSGTLKVDAVKATNILQKILDFIIPKLTASVDATLELSDTMKEEISNLTKTDQKTLSDRAASGVKDIRDSFVQNISSALTGSMSISDSIGGIMDTITSKVVNNFVSGMVDQVFNNLNLGETFGKLLLGQGNAGVAAAGGILDSSLKQGSSPMNPLYVQDANPVMGAGSSSASNPEGGFLSNLFSGIQGFFGKLFGGIGNIFANLLGGLGSLFGGGGSFFSMVFAAEGGKVTGPGTGTSDSIMAMLSNGEYVVNAATTKRWLPFLETLNANDGRLPAFASGGLVGPSNPSAFKTVQENNNNKDKQQVFNINVSGDVSMQTRKEIARMIPEITAGVNMTNRERGSR
jgi:tape measure domain-containing protein